MLVLPTFESPITSTLYCFPVTASPSSLARRAFRLGDIILSDGGRVGPVRDAHDIYIYICKHQHHQHQPTTTMSSCLYGAHDCQKVTPKKEIHWGGGKGWGEEKDSELGVGDGTPSFAPRAPIYPWPAKWNRKAVFIMQARQTTVPARSSSSSNVLGFAKSFKLMFLTVGEGVFLGCDR